MKLAVMKIPEPMMVPTTKQVVPTIIITTYGYILHGQYHLLPKPSFGLISAPILNKAFTNNLGVQGPLI